MRLVDCENCTLTGTLIQDALAGEHTVAGVVPIERQGLVELIRCRRINLTGVQSLEGNPYALYLEDCSDTVITGCSLFDTRAMPLLKAAVKWVGQGTGNLVAQCRFNRPLELPDHVTARDNLVG